MDAAERKDILSRYLDHSRRFDEAAARRSTEEHDGEVIPFTPPLWELEQEPTMREIEVLQLISDGLVNREIGVASTSPRRRSSRMCATFWPSCRHAAAPMRWPSVSGVA